jgi:hypothetical protein
LTVGVVVIQHADQGDENGARDGFREDVGKHEGAGDVEKRRDLTLNKITEESRSAQNVLSLLESHGVVGHVDSRLGVAVNWTRRGEGEPKVE